MQTTKMERLLRKELQRHIGRKKMYKKKYHFTLGVAGILGVINIILMMITFWPTSPEPEIVRAVKCAPEDLISSEVARSTAKDLNHEIYASVYFGCSGTIISKGETFGYGLGCAHCQSIHGNKFTVHYADGSTAPATVVAVDGEHELLLFTVPSESILTTIPVCLNQVPEEGPYNYAIVGYPQHRGPIWYDLKANGVAPTLDRWCFWNEEGIIQGGNSGSGIFINGALCSVLSHRETHHSKSHEGWTCPHQYVVEFCKNNCRKIGGQWFCDRPRNGNDPGPAVWKPTPKEPLTEKEPEQKDPGTKAPEHRVIKRPKGLEERLNELEELIKSGKLDPNEIGKNNASKDDLTNLRNELITQFGDQLSPLQKLILSRTDLTPFKNDIVKMIADIEGRLKQDIANHGINPADITNEIKAEFPVLEGNIKNHINEQFPLMGGLINKNVEGKLGDLANQIDGHFANTNGGLSALAKGNTDLIGKVEAANGLVTGAAAKIPALSSFLAVGGLAGGIPAIVLGVVGWFIHKKVGNNNNSGPSGPSGNNQEDLLETLVDLFIKNNQNPSAPTPTPSVPLPLPLPLKPQAPNPPDPTTPVVTPTGGAPFVANPTHHHPTTLTKVDTVVAIPRAKDTGVQAFQAVKQMIVRLHPELVTQGILQKLDSMFNQAMSGLQGQ